VAQKCVSCCFDARIKILNKMYCSHQYLSIDPKKLQKVVNMIGNISETIKYYAYAMNFMHSPEHEIIIAPVYATQTNS